MSQPDGSALFIADALGLDFLNSGSPQRTTERDWLQNGEHMAAWLIQASAEPPEFLERLKDDSTIARLDEIAAHARDIREWFRRFVLRHMGRSLNGLRARELGWLNRLLREQHKYVQVSYGRAEMSDAPVFRTVWRWRSPDSLLLPIAEALAKVVCDEDFAQIKLCHGRCNLLFVDHTREHARRWCSMSTCGNRAKQEALRKRLKRSRSVVLR